MALGTEAALARRRSRRGLPVGNCGNLRTEAREEGRRFGGDSGELPEDGSRPKPVFTFFCIIDLMSAWYAGTVITPALPHCNALSAVLGGRVEAARKSTSESDADASMA